MVHFILTTGSDDERQKSTIMIIRFRAIDENLVRFQSDGFFFFYNLFSKDFKIHVKHKQKYN